ncbi:hypothetical protein LTR10_018150 [Elasticomyces elasticus]|uniref:Uncharacterized protein n=1 Tax=Exophiala sideris TaxID=1016849 RepID=A0ABR0J319_9EURO|nr:hypothetical protein LTR10_018150 [Elasticomyces elasticus]KAK5024969.1 hypothetical protein LTS07_008347 [Exophiala sideris]KAK5031441.1 hypothetical protein LTR13_007769 [Exophiala sideris]KAK5055007.1 hypothetical protein LTR69_008575 [Exophiala sideris]KAK5179888.1 hypothetical protein LTR44_007704 [Eurotiomycetes sp. CCFEE 6388]
MASGPSSSPGSDTSWPITSMSPETDSNNGQFCAVVPSHHQNRRPTWLLRLIFKVQDLIDSFSWIRFIYYLCSYSYFCLMMYLAYIVLPLPGHWATTTQSDKVPISYQEFNNYFSGFQGFAECNIRATDLYTPPQGVSKYCSRRADLLESMSQGGRIGFDTPYWPKDCHYRWYTIAEVCMILERFDAIVFIGDFSLQNIYNGFNILLRQDLASGTLKTWDMDKYTLQQCRCDNQFIVQSCAGHYVTTSEDVVRDANTAGRNSPYACSRTPHAFLQIDNSPASNDVLQKFKALVPQVPQSNYKPVPVVHSLSPSTLSAEAAALSMLEFLALADASKRKTPMLWIGPTAAGHIDIKDRRGNQEIWDFDKRLAHIAAEHDIEVLKMWNLTVQATSWDGLRFSEKVAITQAMMVINWLSRLESS